MKVFDSEKVNCYSLLVPIQRVYQEIDQLIASQQVEFYTPYPAELISIAQSFRLRKLINQLSGQQPPQTDVTTLSKMRAYIKSTHLDFNKYIHHVQDQLTNLCEQLVIRTNKLINLFRNYEFHSGHIACLQLKIAYLNQPNQPQSVIILSGICSIQAKHRLQKLIFRKTKGYSYLIWNELSKDNNLSIPNSILNLNLLLTNEQKSLKSGFMSQQSERKCAFLCLIERHIHSRISCECTLYEQLPSTMTEIKNVLVTVQKETAALSHLIMMSSQKQFCHSKLLCEAYYLQSLVRIVSHSEHFPQVGFVKITFYARFSPQPHDGAFLTLQNVHTRAQIEQLIKKQSERQNLNSLSYQSNKNSTVGKVTTPLETNEKQVIKNTNIKMLPTVRTILPQLQVLREVNIFTQMYSIPQHNEIIPSVFMLMTVPALFGMMFSDAGHGLLLLIISLILNLPVIVTLMGVMSIYCGIIYNQCFGIRFLNFNTLGILNPVWGEAQNGLNFQNSLKMKISIILGFTHMNFGMCLRFWNHLKKKQSFKKLILDFMPRLGLLWFNIGYMVLMIVVKWCTNYQYRIVPPPSIISAFLQIYLGINHHRVQSIFSSVQVEHNLISIIRIANFLCIFALILNKIDLTLLFFACRAFFGIHRQQSKSETIKYQQLEEEDDDIQGSIDQTLYTQSLIDETTTQQHSEQSAESELGYLEIFEYILNLISSTASYLRLFALSLAHSKLSKLLLDYVLGSVEDHYSSLSLMRCVMFFLATVGLMLVLDVMECLMHVIRLHWIQWMGKFFKGGGYLFEPHFASNHLFLKNQNN